MPAKTCQICGEDCSDRPRVRDGQGRYACKECLERKQRSRGTGRESGPPPATDDAALLAQLVADAPPPQAVPCPQCGGRIDTGNVICTNCGYNTSTGEAVQTRVMKAEKQKRSRAPEKGDRAAVYRVAYWQRFLINCLLLTILAYIGLSVLAGISIFTPAASQQTIGIIAIGIVIALVGISIGFIVGQLQLGSALGWPLIVRLLLIPVMLMGCLSLIFLLLINGMATSYLKKNGVRVGLLGAKL